MWNTVHALPSIVATTGYVIETNKFSIHDDANYKWLKADFFVVGLFSVVNVKISPCHFSAHSQYCLC